MSSYSSEKELLLSVGESYDLDGYVFEFENLSSEKGPNYIADVASLKIQENAQAISLSSE